MCGRSTYKLTSEEIVRLYRLTGELVATQSAASSRELRFEIEQMRACSKPGANAKIMRGIAIS